jgi:hypothetical protein
MKRNKGTFGGDRRIMKNGKVVGRGRRRRRRRRPSL